MSRNNLLNKVLFLVKIYQSSPNSWKSLYDFYQKINAKVDNIVANGTPYQFILILLAKTSALSALSVPKNESSSLMLWEIEREFQDVLERFEKAYNIPGHEISLLRDFSEEILLSIISLTTLENLSGYDCACVINQVMLDLIKSADIVKSYTPVA